MDTKPFRESNPASLIPNSAVERLFVKQEEKAHVLMRGKLTK